jgi:hypothetical protein
VPGAELHDRDHPSVVSGDGAGVRAGERGGVAGRAVQVGADRETVGEEIGEGAEQGRVEGHGARVATPAGEDKGRFMC